MDFPDHRTGDVTTGHPYMAVLASFPALCFMLTLATDLAYWRSANLMWQYFSSWLLLTGLVLAGLAALVGIITVIVHRNRYNLASLVPTVIGWLVVFLLAVWNSFIHARDGWVSVVPTGLILSLATVVAVLVTTWLALFIKPRHRSGVR